MTTKTLLIIDDSRISRMVVRGLITKLRPDINIIEAANAKEGAQATQDHAVDAALIDHGMPDEPGLELAARLKVEHPDLTIYMLTANIQDIMKKRAKDLGVGFIEKPPTEEKMVSFLQGAML